MTLDCTIVQSIAKSESLR